MTLLATSGLATLVPFLLLIACPLAMLLMMRGMHGHGGHERAQAETRQRGRMTLDELKHHRDELNEEIGQRAEQRAHSRSDRSGETT